MPVKAGLEKLSSDINEKFGKGSSYLAGKMQFQSLPRIPTGVFSLDVALGGGWPRGRIQHIYGPFSSSKTTLSLHSIAQAQKYCHWCSLPLEKCSTPYCGAKDPIAAMWIDAERTFDPEWARKIGINFDYFIVANPEYGELAIDMMDKANRSGDVGIIVLDSVAALTFASQIEKGAEESEQPGILAKHMTRGLRRWTAGLNARLKHPTNGKEWDNLCSIICLNQVRDVLNSRYPMPPQPPAGKGLRHWASTEVSLSFQQSDFEWEGSEDKGEQSALSQTVTFMTHKNKTAPPRRSGQYTITFADASIDNEKQIYKHAIRYGLIQVAGSWVTYVDGKKTHKIQGSDKMFKLLQEEGVFPRVAAQVYAKVNGEAD